MDTTGDARLSRDHYLTLSNGRFATTTRADLDHLIANLSSGDQRNKPLVVHFHGGLVPEAHGMGIVRDLQSVYELAGGYPVFFVWKSGVLEVITANLRDIFQERIFQVLLEQVTRYAVAKVREGLGARGGRLAPPHPAEVQDELRQPTGGREPFSTTDPRQVLRSDTLSSDQQRQFREELERDRNLRQEAEAIANAIRTPQEVAAEAVATRGARVQASSHTLMSPDVLEELRREAPLPGSRGPWLAQRIIVGAIKTLAAVVGRYAGRRDHGLYPTVVEEILREFYLGNIGRTIWSQMKEDTAQAFGDDPAIFGGTAFLEGLKAMGPERRPVRIILVGHSAGAVYICHFLRHAAEVMPDVKFDVVLLAPACTFQLMNESISYFRNNVRDLRLFTMNDEFEIKDQLVPLVYPRSLLYFVSGVVEDEADMPLVGMARYYVGRGPFIGDPFDQPINFLKASTSRLVWSKTTTGDPGLLTDATSHGDFDSNRLTLESIQNIIRGGFSPPASPSPAILSPAP